MIPRRVDPSRGGGRGLARTSPPRSTEEAASSSAPLQLRQAGWILDSSSLNEHKCDWGGGLVEVRTSPLPPLCGQKGRHIIETLPRRCPGAWRRRCGTVCSVLPPSQSPSPSMWPRSPRRYVCVCVNGGGVLWGGGIARSASPLNDSHESTQLLSPAVSRGPPSSHHISSRI